MDFVSGLKEVEADTYEEPPPRNTVERFWAWLVSTSHSNLCNVFANPDDILFPDRCNYD